MYSLMVKVLHLQFSYLEIVSAAILISLIDYFSVVWVPYLSLAGNTALVLMSVDSDME